MHGVFAEDRTVSMFEEVLSQASDVLIGDLRESRSGTQATLVKLCQFVQFRQRGRGHEVDW